MSKAKSTRKAPARKASTSSKGAMSAPDAISLLKADHDKVKKLFKQFEKVEDDSEKQEIATVICKELTVHTKIEEEIFYPAAREGLKEDDQNLLDEADVEHASAKELIAQIEAGSPHDDHWDAKVKVLGEYINHHVEEEQNEMFPKVKKAKVDLKTLGEQMQTRKEELSAEETKAPRKGSSLNGRRDESSRSTSVSS